MLVSKRIVVVTLVAGLAVAGFAGTAAARSAGCKQLLLTSEISKIVGAPVTAQKPFSTTGQLACHWVNTSDEVNLNVYTGSRVSQFGFTRDHPLTGYTMKSVAGVGKAAFVRLDANGQPIDLWALTKRAAFNVQNANIDKDAASIETELTALAKKLAKRLK